MKHFISLLLIISLGTGLVGCSNMSNQDTGTLSGGVIGGLLGSQFGQGSGQIAAIAVGALAGAYIGGAIGKNMDDNDRMRMDQALEANSVGQPAYWQNQRTGVHYEVVPVRNVTRNGNRYCREYRTVANIAGKQQQMYGTACRRPDGSWKAIS